MHNFRVLPTNRWLRSRGSTFEGLEQRAPSSLCVAYSVMAAAAGDQPPPATLAGVARAAALAGAKQTAAALAPAAVAVIGIYVSSLESGGGTPVDKAHCDCSCWDGRFKGRHARGGYKHMYFNIVPNTALMLMWTAFWLHMLGLGLARIWGLAAALRLRLAALLPAGLIFYPTFYGAWAVINYLNEDFFMLKSQLFFCATELAATYCLYQMLDSRLEPSAALLAAPLAITAAHMYIAVGSEGILWGLFSAAVKTPQTRDVMLMAGDVAQLAYFGWELWRLLRAGGGGGGWAQGGESAPLKRGSGGAAADCEQGAAPDSSPGSSGDLTAARGVRWRGGGPGSGGAAGGGARSGGGGGGCGAGGGDGLEPQAARQLGWAAAASVGLVVSYKLFFSYPVEL
ncbi:MAG: hypothetical protein J3K34DRAFT_505411 [Monoraphidium minutum]|nr:MAG: hypothetical protein J3K34DRAFT_505411 [Monoraphidium minutum]